ncbi:hypothetical protein BGZ96_000580 [Linnemannia gamsii]|uniref:BTB domain-containing protein n=1 Tax=Linnemannia gamsii TaxID=64522 RepID=A0ABQ7JNV5_9FUNG|nr:hypothetical protein BGZ96_000580 [Linnemannia gamsii]
MSIVDPWDMSAILTVYKDLLTSNEGDILVKLKDGKQLKIISFLIKKRSSVFKTMLESPMTEAATGVVDLSTQYGLEAFREFMAYIYYNKLYAGSFVPLLFEILTIADYYEVDAYRTYLNDRIIALITNVPICLMIASEAQKHGTLTEKIYAKCLRLLVDALAPNKRVCYDTVSGNSMPWCCSNHSRKPRLTLRTYWTGIYTVDGVAACIDATTRKSLGLGVGDTAGYSERCCIHRMVQSTLLTIDELPGFIVDDVMSAMTDDEEVGKDDYESQTAQDRAHVIPTKEAENNVLEGIKVEVCTECSYDSAEAAWA